jgi:hypothetical protein
MSIQGVDTYAEVGYAVQSLDSCQKEEEDVFFVTHQAYMVDTELSAQGTEISRHNMSGVHRGPKRVCADRALRAARCMEHGILGTTKADIIWWGAVLNPANCRL